MGTRVTVPPLGGDGTPRLGGPSIAGAGVVSSAAAVDGARPRHLADGLGAGARRCGAAVRDATAGASPPRVARRIYARAATRLPAAGPADRRMPADGSVPDAGAACAVGEAVLRAVTEVAVMGAPTDGDLVGDAEIAGATVVRTSTRPRAPGIPTPLPPRRPAEGAPEEENSFHRGVFVTPGRCYYLSGVMIIPSNHPEHRLCQQRCRHHRPQQHYHRCREQ